MVDWLIAHLIGDYLLQNDWMAQNKKLRSWPCFVHVAIYSATMWAMTQWPPWAMLVVFATHFVQDRTGFVKWYMLLIGQSKFVEPPMAPWSIIVVDNVMHIVVLYGIDRLLKS